MRKTILALAACLACLACLGTPAWAAGGGGGGGGGGASVQEMDPDYRAGQEAVKAEDWPEAVGHLNKAIQTDPKNADAWNLLGFSYRHMGEMDKSFQHYEKALALNPRHRDAHEYVGEAYLQVGQLEGAERHLKALDKLCWLPCEQYTELKEKIEQFKRTRGKS